MVQASEVQRNERQIRLSYRDRRALQRERIRAENRLRSANLCRFCGGKKIPKKDHENCAICNETCGHCEGTGRDPIQLPEAALEFQGVSIQYLKDAEERSSKHLVRLFRQHHLHDVFKDCDGIGEELGAQLIGMIGDFGRFRNPAKLWAYLGLGVESDGTRQRRHRGEQANFKPDGQVWAFKVGEQFWHWGKNGTYGEVYRQRLALEEAKDEKGAKRRAARYVVKQMLKHLWCVANGAEES